MKPVPTEPVAVTAVGVPEDAARWQRPAPAAAA